MAHVKDCECPAHVSERSYPRQNKHVSGVMAHTPGPWRAHPDHGVSDGHGGLIATAQGYNTAEVNKANARLIAAAPELVEALRGCADALREAGKDFALTNPRAVRPNLYELHEQTARAVLAKVA